MPMNLQFRQKILLAASLVMIAAFSLFALYSDYLQRNAIDAVNAGGTTLTEPYINAASKELIITIATPAQTAAWSAAI